MLLYNLGKNIFTKKMKNVYKHKPDLIIFVTDSEASGVSEIGKSRQWKNERRTNYSKDLDTLITMISVEDGINMAFGGPGSKFFIPYTE
jgi:hypothetical protein